MNAAMNASVSTRAHVAAAGTMSGLSVVPWHTSESECHACCGLGMPLCAQLSCSVWSARPIQCASVSWPARDGLHATACVAPRIWRPSQNSRHKALLAASHADSSTGICECAARSLNSRASTLYVSVPTRRQNAPGSPAAVHD